MSEASRVADSLNDKIRNLFARGVVKMVNAALKMQAVQVSVLNGELLDNVEHAENYGFTSRAHPGAEAFLGFVSGARSHGIALVVADRRFRVTDLEDGEVCIYTDEGDTVHFKRGRTIETTTENAIVNCKTAVVNASETANVKTGVYTLEADMVNWIIGGWSVASKSGEAITATMAVNLEQQGWHHSTGDQIAAGVSQTGHVHDGIARGNDSTNVPVGGG